MAKQEALFSEFKIDSGAEFSSCRKYRYALWRIWDESKLLAIKIFSLLLVVMLFYVSLQKIIAMPSLIDLTGKTFGSLSVLKQGEHHKGFIKWVCLCECGTKKQVRGSHLRKGESKSCGCKKNEAISKRHLADITNKRFGILTVVSRAENNKNTNKPNWLCKCDCGNGKIISSNALLNNATKSCGCQQYLKGEKHSRWKGGRNITQSGYIEIYAPEHSMSNSKGYILEHRLVMANKIRRNLLDTETVHHKNGNRKDNRIDNLELWNSSHPSGQKVSDLIKHAQYILKTYTPIEKYV